VGKAAWIADDTPLAMLVDRGVNEQAITVSMVTIRTTANNPVRFIFFILLDPFR
jgi:hypothetical protein